MFWIADNPPRMVAPSAYAAPDNSCAHACDQVTSDAKPPRITEKSNRPGVSVTGSPVYPGSSFLALLADQRVSVWLCGFLRGAAPGQGTSCPLRFCRTNNWCLLDFISPVTDASIARKRQPSHLDRIIPASRNAMLLASASIRKRKHCNSFLHRQGLRTTGIHTQATPRTLLFEDARHPLTHAVHLQSGAGTESVAPLRRMCISARPG